MAELALLEKDKVVTDSQIIAQALGIKHNKVMGVIENLLDDYPDLRELSMSPKTNAGSRLRVGSKSPKFEEYLRIEERSYRNRTFKAAVLNRQAFTLLFMRFTTPKARELQREFNQAFYEMEKRLMGYERNQDSGEWITARNVGKLARREETDVIKEFVEYATAQGSKNAKFYYKHVTTATYKALDLVAKGSPPLRDTLSIYDTAALTLMEKLAKDKLNDYMALGRNYKDIYKCVAADLNAYGENFKAILIAS